MRSNCLIQLSAGYIGVKMERGLIFVSGEYGSAINFV